MIQYPTDVGYAISALDSVFFEASVLAEGGPDTVHVSYAGLKGIPHHLPASFDRLFDFNLLASRRTERKRLVTYLRRHSITRILAFDLAPKNPTNRALRAGGATHVVSYLGGPMGSRRSGLVLALKRLEMSLRRSAPDRYVFESQGMLETGVLGRGIREERAVLVRLGVDTSRFAQNPARRSLYRALGVPDERLVVLYSGHMLERKGLPILMQAARHLVHDMDDRRFHIVLCGNRAGESEQWLRLLDGTEAQSCVTFAGYRTDMPDLMAAADIGVIPSHGWDSFTMSAVEMAASHLPLVVTDLPGLRETVIDGITGLIVPAGNPRALAQALRGLADPTLRRNLGDAARARAEREFSRDRQINQIAQALDPSSLAAAR